MLSDEARAEVKPCRDCLFCYANKRGEWVLELAADLITGMTQREAYARYGAAASSVTRLRRMLGISGRHDSPSASALGVAKRALDEGLGYRSAAELSGVSATTLARRFPGMGRAQISPEKLKRIEEMLDDGAPVAEIIRTLNLGKDTVSRHFPGRGFTQEQITERATMGRLESRIFGQSLLSHSKKSLTLAD